ncbi:MAG: TOBE domain-containing protein [Candidatus Eisenbacteria bacterium]|nr:TOBE domain-containing protein [Candidatus Eisenbacteria bacterium]
MNAKRVRSLARAGKLPAVRVGRRWLFPRERLEHLLGERPGPRALGLEALSARNHLRGRVAAIAKDGLMAEITIDVGGQPLVAIITRASAERLGLTAGDDVLAVIKSTEVMVAK